LAPTHKKPVAFGKYVLLEKIASGGMAEVFRAVLRGAAGFEKQVAVKRILPVFCEEPEFITLFQDEARIASTLTHANIAQVFELGEVDGAHYLALELVDGLDLARVAARLKAAGQPMPPVTAAFIVAEAARGLAHAHEKTGPDGRPVGIVHRDVSPPNILVSRAGDVKVADFGIAKAAGKVHKTETGVLMGKLRYMSPEQLAGQELDARSDIFSLGVVLYELLAGGPIFEGEQTLRLAELIQKAEIPPPSTRNPTVPRALDELVLRALARPREARYPSAADLARDLSRFVSTEAPSFAREDLGALVDSLEPPVTAATLPTELAALPLGTAVRPPAATRDLGPARRRGSMTPLVAALLVVILGSGALIFVRFVLPAGDDPRPDAARLAVVAPDAAALPPDAPPSAAFTLAPLAPAEQRRALEDAVQRFEVTRRGLPGGGYEAYLTGLDTLLAGLVLDGEGRPEEPPGLSPIAHELVRRAGVEEAVAATIAYVRGTGELPPLVRSAARSFLARRSSIATGPAADAGAYAASVLAVWLEPGNPARLRELAEANDALGRWCEPPPAPYRHFAPVGCEAAALVQALRAARRKDPTADAIERWHASAPDGEAFGILHHEYQAPSNPAELRLVVELAGHPSGEVTVHFGDGARALGPLEGEHEGVLLGAHVPRRLVAPVLRIAGVPGSLRLPPPPFGR
jgi:hypothetical protein